MQRKVASKAAKSSEAIQPAAVDSVRNASGELAGPSSRSSTGATRKAEQNGKSALEKMQED